MHFIPTYATYMVVIYVWKIVETIGKLQRFVINLSYTFDCLICILATNLSTNQTFQISEQFQNCHCIVFEIILSEFLSFSLHHVKYFPQNDTNPKPRMGKNES